MIGSLLSWQGGRGVDRMRFSHPGESGRAVSDNVLRTFREGSQIGLKGEPFDLFLKKSQAIPWNMRAFFNEGHAMGMAGRSACSFRRSNPELPMKSVNYQVMRFVGYGFWNGVATVYPVRWISEEGSYWKEISIFPKYRLLMSNGYGFASVLFRGEFDKKTKEDILTIDDPRRREAVFHGVGRVLWFLYLNNVPALTTLLDEHEDIVEPLAIGLGLAIAFTQVATPENIIRTLDQFPESRRPHLIRGIGIALQVHAQNDPECRSTIEKTVTGELRNWYEGACRASEEAGNGGEWYPKYHELTLGFTGLSKHQTKEMLWEK